MRNVTQAGLVALIMAAAPAAASASVIVDTGTPVNSTANWSLFSSVIPVQGQFLAARFDLSQATTLTNLEGFVGGFGGTFSIAVASDSGGDPASDTPVSTLFSQQARSIIGTGAWSGVHGVSWSLDPGTYWVIFSVRADQGDTFDGYMPNNAPNPTSAAAFYNIPGSVWGRRDDLNLGVRINDDVPEPAIWTMMLAGFGLAGAALRRRPVAAA